VQGNNKPCTSFPQNPTIPTSCEQAEEARSDKSLTPSTHGKDAVLHAKCANSVQLSDDAAEKRCTCIGAELSEQQREAMDLWRSLTPELSKVAQGLPDLPESVRAGIVAMVKATEKERELP